MLRIFRTHAPRASRPAPEIAYFEVSHCGETFRVNLKRSAAARRFTLRVRAAASDVVLTIPARAKLGEAQVFAQRHAAWIGARLRRVPERTPFQPGEYVPLRGVPHQIALRPSVRGNVWIERNAQSPDEAPLICVNADFSFAPRRVLDFLVKEARRDLEAAVARHAERIGARRGRITLRDTTTRWGSCSASGALNFSWRLIMAPPFVLDYLAAHEVAHLAHMNHSADFWRVVAQLTSDRAPAEAWLKAHGAGLLRYRPGKGDGANQAD